MIKIDNLNFKYQNKEVFKDFNLEIHKNSFVSIIGSNNSGKTTLIKLILGILPNKNTIIVNHSYMNNKNMKVFSSSLGVYLQDYQNIFLMNDVYDELSFPLENLNYDQAEINRIITKLAKDLNEEKLITKKIKELTTTQRQKLQFMLAVIHQPKLIILDNPFVNFSYTEKQKYLNYLKELKSKQVTILLFSTDLEESLNSDYIHILFDGKIALEGKPLEVMNEDKLLIRLGFKIPFMVDLSQKLMFYEILDDIELDMEKMVNKLWK